MAKRKFTAQRTTIIRDLMLVMNRLGATSLKIGEQNLLDDTDNAAVITFDKHGKRYVSKCKVWEYFSDNLRAAQLAITYTWRIMEGYGVEYIESEDEQNMLDKVFGWLEAPLDPNILLLGSGGDWWDVLGVDTKGLNRASIVNAFKALSKVHHPDVGGNPDDFIRLKEAYEQAIEYLNG